MKLKITTEITTEIEIEFPYFAKQGIFAYCFIDENHCIQVQQGKFTCAAIQILSVYPESFLLIQKCTQDEFLLHYQNAQAELTLQYHELFSKNHILES